MKNITLNNGVKIPVIGLGLWKVKSKNKFQDVINAGIEAGYTHFDSAQIYENEAMLGDALRKNGADRSKLFITTKIWNDNQWWDDMLPSFEESLHKLQTDYVDLLLLHFPVTETRRPAWRRMEEIYSTGKAKSIGVSNYTIRHLEELLRECSVKPAVNQVELHVFLQQPELVRYCMKNDIAVEAYSPLAHGYRHDDEVLLDIAKKHGKTPSQIMIRWCIEIGTVPLPKSNNPERIRENIDVFDFEMDLDDMKKIASLESNFRTCWDPTHTP